MACRSVLDADLLHFILGDRILFVYIRGMRSYKMQNINTAVAVYKEHSPGGSSECAVIDGTIEGVTRDTKDKRTKASRSNQNRPSTHGSPDIRRDQWA